MRSTQRVHILDPASVARLDWIAHALQHAPQFQMSPGDVRASFIVRRCIEAYTSHLEGVLLADDAHAELRHRAEVSRLRSAADGADLGVRAGQLTTDPVRPLSSILAERHARQPKPI